MRNLVKAEWIKFASLRASWTRLSIALLLNGVFVAFTLWAFDRSAGDIVPDTSIAARVATLSAGVSMAALVFVVMGVNVHTAEIKSRTIIPTAGAAPDRRDLIGAKALLSGIVGLVAGAGLESALQAFLPEWIDRLLPFEAGKSLIVAGSDHQLPPSTASSRRRRTVDNLEASRPRSALWHRAHRYREHQAVAEVGGSASINHFETGLDAPRFRIDI